MKNIFFVMISGILVGFSIAWFLYWIQSTGKQSDSSIDNSTASYESHHTSTPDVHETTPEKEYPPSKENDDSSIAESHSDSIESEKKREAGDRLVKTIKGVEFAFRWCPAGSFVMGSSEFETGRFVNESPHQIDINEGFWIMETEVTQQQWQAINGKNPSNFDGNDLPVENVSWNDCQEFCQKTGLQLPTEVQWEYACRAGSKESNPGILDRDVWYKENSNKTTHPVGLKRKNAWNIFDMQGNVWEWCEDNYRDFFTEETSLRNKISDSSYISPKEKKILQALNELTTFDFNYTPLEDVIAEIRDMHHIDVQLDTSAFRDEMISPEEVELSIKISGVTLRSALNRMLKDELLTFVIDDGCILITTKTKADELFQKSQRIREIFLSIDNSIVKQHEEKILQSLEKDVSLRFDDEPLTDVIDRIKQQQHIEVQLDDLAFKDEMIIPEEISVNVNVSGVTFRSALNRMLNGLDLTFVIVDECILVTTKNEVKNTYIPNSHQNDFLTYPTVSPSKQFRVIRGGAWDNDDRLCRPTVRDCCSPHKGYNNVGFRCVMPQ